MRLDEEELFAWLDGELDAEESARVAATVAADPELARFVADHRLLRKTLHDAFDRILEQPMPGSLAKAAAPASVIDFDAHKQRRHDALRSVPRNLPQWMGLAAALAFGVMIGRPLYDRGDAPYRSVNSQLYAAAALDQALNDVSPSRTGDPRAILTFRDRDGLVCRTYSAAATGEGLACFDGQGWRIEGMFAQSEGQAAEMRMASSSDELNSMVESRIADRPFDAAQTNEAKKKGWR